MGKVNISDYKIIYLETAREYADKLSRSCIELSKNPSNLDALKELHISSHSLKSQSQVMSYTNMSKITGSIEKIAREILEGKYTINDRIILLLNKAIIEINLLLKNKVTSNKERSLDYLIKKLDDVSGV